MTSSILQPIEHKAIYNLYSFLDKVQASRPWLNRFVTPIVFSVEVSKALVIPIYAIEGVALTAIKLACQPSVSNAWKLCKYTVTTAFVTAAVVMLSRQASIGLVALSIYATYKQVPTTFNKLASVAGHVAAHPHCPIIQEAHLYF